MSHTVAFAEGTFNPVAQMGNPDCFKLFTPEELEAIQWDSLEEEMAGSIEYDIVPDYDKLLDLMTAAKREARGAERAEVFAMLDHHPRRRAAPCPLHRERVPAERAGEGLPCWRVRTS